MDGFIPVPDHSLQGLRISDRESLKLAVAARWNRRASSVVTLLYFLVSNIPGNAECHLAYFYILMYLHSEQ